jgi:predicted ribosome quality control (RQC) complex YloA/Tae2 family protein
MAEQVELDMDDAQEKTLNVVQPQQEESLETPSVDLGYTEHKQGEQIETEVEKNEDNLSEISTNVEKRIAKLTRNWREAERREKAALDYAKGLQTKYSKVEKTASEVDDNYVKEFEARVDAEREQVKDKLKKAIESQDSEKIMQANDELTKLAVEKEKARIRTTQKEQQKKEQEEQAQAQPVEQAPQVQPSPKAQSWVGKNSWFGQDKAMTNAAFGIHEDLVQKGFDPESDEYYTEVDKQIRGYFPSKFAEDERPVQTVASAGRKQQGS